MQKLAHTPAPAVGDHPAEPAPDFFTGIGLAVDQIENDMRNETQVILRRLVTAQRNKNATALKLSCEALSKHLAGMQSVADVVARQCIAHINRRSRP